MTSISNSLNDHSSPGPLRRWIPNILTFFRLACVPSIVFLILKDHLLFAFGIFALASITDILDGYLARRWNVTSTFGLIFDPLADKFLLVCSALTLGYLLRIPTWMVILIIGRDILILLAAMIIYLFKLPVKLAPILSSKINTFSQIILVGMVLLTNYTYGKIHPIPAHDLLMSFILWITALTTLWSGIEYTLYFFKETLYPRNTQNRNGEKPE